MCRLTSVALKLVPYAGVKDLLLQSSASYLGFDFYGFLTHGYFWTYNYFALGNNATPFLVALGNGHVHAADVC